MFTSLKRRIGDVADAESGAERSQSPFDYKKRRILPLRPSPISTSHEYATHNIIISPRSSDTTPASSDEDAPTPPIPLFNSPPPPQPFAKPDFPDHARPSEPTDYDMMDTVSIEQHPSFVVSPANPSQRLPTPIYSTFANPMNAPPGGHPPFPAHNQNTSYARYRQPFGRALPSPISERDDSLLLSPMTGRGVGEMMGRLGVRGADDIQEDKDMEIESPRSDCGDRQRRGRSRSRRADGKDCGEGRPTLCMGYRADCDKCQAKVPGHYSHLLRV